ncbi:hypothetical protein [Tropicibacter oceani]|uniref:Sulphotransferase Stf0 domain-containing protein n=1 Tax=Tropicibacter oceani TaxID=3058420 RepID=A0ABY8QN41_9RHOB|nr:hypothetical protein [Tropicibacter oceani]WGW06050.1 hypothetical protein QF118_19765 [Tropicibacter oceani]
MSFPYIIWTMQRTGGTTLASLLAVLSEHPGVQHEAFNEERVFGHVVGHWEDPERMRQAMQAVLEPRPVIKHCHELLPPVLNIALLEISTALGYRHIILERRAEVDRILSLELAKITGAWGSDQARRIYRQIEEGVLPIEPINIPRALAHMRECAARRIGLDTLFESQGLSPYRVCFEDIYTDPVSGRALVDDLLAFLDIDPGAHPQYEGLVTEALVQKGQNSTQVAEAVPNFDEARAQLTEAYNALIESPPKPIP